MTASIEALYIFDSQRNCILDHIYNGRPPRPQDLISRFTAHPAPQPAILHLPDLAPATTAYSLRHSNLLLIAVRTADTQALAILEFLRRLVDIFEDFLGSPLLSTKIEESYEIVAQILAEVCDGGIICNTEPNALHESIEVSSLIGKLFTQVGIPSSSPSLSSQSNLSSTLRPTPSLTTGPAIPWRKANVRHTSNELYVDIVETLNVIFAPSGRPLHARSNGSIAFTAKISGVPDLIMVLSAPGGTSSSKSAGISRTMQLPSFHPCVRLARWRDHPGELSFVPPDGRFMLAGYEVDLLPYDLQSDRIPSSSEQLFLPATADLKTALGPNGTDFEARLTLNNAFPGTLSSKPKSAAPASTTLSQFSFGSASAAGTSTTPTLESVLVSIPMPKDVRNVTDFRASRGDAIFNFATKTVEWKVPTKDGASVAGTAVLTGTISGPRTEEPDDEDMSNPQVQSMSEYYDEDAVQSTLAASTNGNGETGKPQRANAQSRSSALMPRAVAVSFAVKGWLPSGIKVESLNVDVKKSKGLGEGVKPYKGVKYLTVSRKGVERRV